MTGAGRENTVEAFAAARGVADGVEMDVRRCADGTLVVHHDAVVGDIGPIDKLRRSELPQWVPHLSDALAACRDLLVNVEVKSDTEGPAHDPQERCATAAARVCAGAIPGLGPAAIVLSSFSLPALLAARKETPELPLGWLCGTEAFLDLPSRLEMAVAHGLAAIHPLHLLIDSALIRDAHNAGLLVRAWTVDDPERVAELAVLGVDAVITNDVPAALKALGRA
jgi:glycerophosphoryl diester phosphodiesterase